MGAGERAGLRTGSKAADSCFCIILELKDPGHWVSLQGLKFLRLQNKDPANITWQRAGKLGKLRRGTPANGNLGCRATTSQALGIRGSGVWNMWSVPEKSEMTVGKDACPRACQPQLNPWDPQRLNRLLQVGPRLSFTWVPTPNIHTN